MKTLRPYQVKFIEAIRIAIGIYKRIIACAATGAGKTVVFLEIIKMALERGSTVLVITESRKIFKQIIEQQHGKLIAAGVDKFYIKKNQVYIAMAQTLKRRKEMIQNFAALNDNLLIISDEAHVAVANPIIEQLPDAYLIGFTATPCAKASPWIPTIYKHVVVGPQPLELVLDGYLCRYKHFQRQVADLSKLEVRGGEYTEESQELVFDTRVVFDGLVADLKSTPFKKCVVFCASIKHAEHVYEELVANGFDCCCVHSQRPNNEFDKFTKGSAIICVSVGILTKGVDHPPIDLICIDRKIMSLPLYLQICGRASRIYPGKEFWTVLDYGMNFDYHRSWIEERDWNLLAAPRKKKEKKEAPAVRSCEQCESIIPVATRKCPFCGYERSAEEKEVPESILVEVTPMLDQYNTIRGKNVHSLTPEELSIYAKFLKKQKFASLIARWRDQQEPGFLKAYGATMQYKNGFVWMQKKMMTPEKVEDFVIR